MSSCNNKRVNIEKYAEPPRTPYDQLMNKVYDPVGNYFAAPFPMPRTNYDIEFQKLLCPKCGFGFKSDSAKYQAPFKNPYTREGYANPPYTHYDQLLNKVYSANDKYFAAPYPMQRTNYDVEFQKILCPRCGTGFTPDTNKYQPSFKNPYHSKENYCGSTNSHPALILNDNDNTWSYNATMM